MRKTIVVIALLAVTLPVSAMLAVLVSSRTGSSVSGQAIWICTYTAGGQTFDRIIPLSAGPCPPTINVQ